jgi:hypothetical protein
LTQLLATFFELQKICEFLDGQTCLPDDRSQSPFGNFRMIWNSQASVRRRLLSENHVAAALSIKHVIDLTKCFDNFAA